MRSSTTLNTSILFKTTVNKNIYSPISYTTKQYYAKVSSTQA